MPAVSYTDYADLMLAMQGTAEQIAARVGWAKTATRVILRRMQALHLAHASHALIVGNTKTWVWSRGIGDGGNRKSLRPKASHIGFAHLWRELEAGATVLGAAEATGAAKPTVHKLLMHLRRKRQAHVCAWEKDAMNRPVAVWRIGVGNSVPKPKRSNAEKQRAYRQARSADALRTVWMPAANAEQQRRAA